MMPNMNPKQMKRMMKQLGMKMDEIDASEVVIKTSSGDLVVKNPQVVRMNVQGQDSFQVTGNVSEGGVEGEEAAAEFSEDDVKLVSEQANVSEEKAREALESAGGDIAKAILSLE
jgi:nascent polypeptide-associated complex subunit alpha